MGLATVLEGAGRIEEERAALERGPRALGGEALPALRRPYP
jgi:hypothetical protein